MKTFLVCYFIVLWFSITGLFADKTKEESINDGQEIYQDFCVQCHLANGTGVSGVFPPLKASDYLFENIEKSIAGVATRKWIHLGFLLKCIIMLAYTERQNSTSLWIPVEKLWTQEILPSMVQ